MLSHLVADDSPYGLLLGDNLYEQYDVSDYAGLDHAERRPSMSPVDLASVTGFQFVESLSDPQAAHAVLCEQAGSMPCIYSSTRRASTSVCWVSLEIA